MQARKKTRKILIEFHLAPLNCYSSPSTVWNKSSLQTFYCSSIGGLTKILFYFISYIDGVSIYLVTRLLLLLIGSHNRGKNVFFFLNDIVWSKFKVYTNPSTSNWYLLYCKKMPTNEIYFNISTKCATQNVSIWSSENIWQKVYA